MVILVAACPAETVMYRPGQELRSLSTETYSISVQKNGRLDLVLSNRIEMFSNVRPMAWIDGATAPEELDVEGKRSYRQEVNTVLGEGQGMVLDAKDGQWIIHAYPNKPFVIIQLVYKNPGKKTVRLRSLHPWSVGGDVEGMVFFGGTPDKISVLAPWPFEGGAPSLDRAGASSWIVAGINPQTNVSLIAGFLNYDGAHGEFALAPDEDTGHAFRADYVFDAPVDVLPGETVASAPLYLAVSETDPLEGLERFAVAASRTSNGQAAWLPPASRPDDGSLLLAPAEARFIRTTDVENPERPEPLMLDAAGRYFVAPWLGTPLMPSISLHGTPEFPASARRSLATALAMLGGAVQLDGISDEDRTLVNALSGGIGKPARPIDLFYGGTPRILALPLAGALDGVTVLGVFNWGNAAPQVTIPLASLGLIPGEYYEVYDIWRDARLGRAVDSVTVSVENGEMAVFALRVSATQPALLGIASSVTMGANLISTSRWDAGNRMLEGTLAAIDRPVSLRVLVPEAYGIQSADVAGVETPVTRRGELVTLDVAGSTNPRTWRIRF